MRDKWIVLADESLSFNHHSKLKFDNALTRNIRAKNVDLE